MIDTKCNCDKDQFKTDYTVYSTMSETGVYGKPVIKSMRVF